MLDHRTFLCFRTLGITASTLIAGSKMHTTPWSQRGLNQAPSQKLSIQTSAQGAERISYFLNRAPERSFNWISLRTSTVLSPLSSPISVQYLRNLSWWSWKKWPQPGSWLMVGDSFAWCLRKCLISSVWLVKTSTNMYYSVQNTAGSY